MKSKLADLKDNIVYARGIMNGRRAYKGPHFLEFDIINSCNINCVGCYYHSELKNDRYSDEWKKFKLPKDSLYQLIDEASSIDTGNVLLTGNGETLLYPDIVNVVKEIKARDMGCVIVTNGTLIDKEMIDGFIDVKLDHIIFSLWDYDERRYAKLRPGHESKLEKIKYWLTRSGRAAYPKVNVVYLVNAENYKFLEDMIKFALKYNVDKITFKLMRVYDDLTVNYFLNPDQINAVIKELNRLNSKYSKSIATNIKQFVQFLSSMQPEKYLYLNNFLRSFPCYIGWFYAVILDNGDVIPCCGCRKYVMGNVYKDKLSNIWNSPKYKEFRYKALYSKEDSEFDSCNCVHMCSHYQLNMSVNSYLSFLQLFHRKGKV